ncbi:MAG: isoleucine--tRNA ligase, partial [Oscillospiraceae bacterium]|nr:isoleucine--tRNA ligase [Oscillospiraceae bacterium]
MYQKVDSELNFAIREVPVLEFWKENKIFERSISDKPKDAPVYSFYDGPPTANGKPHIGHVLTRTIKDAIPRYRTMKGYRVLRKAGWDTHGLPVELEVEKELGISGKPEIENFGVDEFIKKCKESVWVYEGFWKEMSERVAYWADMEQPYVTYHNEYIESVWWALSEIWKQDLIYKGYRIVPYCPRCGTPLSSHEVAQGYKDITETSVIVKFRMKGENNTYFLAWTTTPWTLPSNVALCINPEKEYVRVQKGDEIYVMAKELVTQVLEKDYEILDTKLGKEWVGAAYHPLLPYAEPLLDTKEKYCTIVADGYVTLTNGTGIVHQAPAFGEDDARVCKLYGMPFVNLVDEQGKFIEAVTPWTGMFVKDADEQIVAVLKDNDQLFKTLDYTHNYPFCWRCKTALLYYPREAWFIKMTFVRDQLLENSNTVNWMPDNIRTGRFGNFLENVVDWSVSRERYWGTPLPIWECGDCKHQVCVGSIAELRQMAINLPEEIDLHKPHIDNILLKCVKCNDEMTRVPEVIDCWFDAGSMPFAQWHYPFENKEIFDENFPADFISEAVDQTRGWFYALIAISTLLFKRTPYKNVIVLGHVQDKNGQKLSKSLGNYVDPMETIAEHGADAVRWYFYISSAPWLNTRFSEEAVTDAQRRFMGTVWNTYAFYVLYANIDDFNPAEHELDYKKLSVMDLWIVSRLNSLVKKVDNCMEKYELTESARALNQFADELSNWYVRRCRERFWGPEMTEDKIAAFRTLFQALHTLIHITAP